LEMQCRKLTDLVRKAAEEVDSIKAWAQHDGIVAPTVGQQGTKPPASRATGVSLLSTFSKIRAASTNPGTSQEKDPDLTFAVQRVLTMSAGLDALRNGMFCGKVAPEDDEDDDDDDEDDVPSPAPAPGPAVAAVAAVEEIEEVPVVNASAMTSLLVFQDDMKSAVDNFESSVHPHGNKWWRYRYEYTFVESFVVAFSVILLYGVMYLLHGVSFFGKFKFYNIGVTSRLYRYAWGYFVFHAAALMLMVTSAYFLYMPWGDSNIFDIGAKALHTAVDGRANLPILGHSWLIMVLDVQFQLFVCFAIYGLFIFFVIRNFQRALDDWKAIADEEVDKVPNRRLVPSFIDNADLYTSFGDILLHRVQVSEPLQDAFRQARLRLPGVDTLDNPSDDWHDFSLHLYLTDALGKALEYLVEVSLKSNGFIAVSSLCVAVLAHHFQVAFMYFLPIFVVIGFLLFAVGFIASRRLRRAARDRDNITSLNYVTLHNYCRAIQIVLYFVFFSFSRLLLSNDIFTNYPKVYMAACFGLAAILFFAWFIAGEILKETICGIVLPPHVDVAHFKKNLQLVAYWHTTENCHECGVRQLPCNASLSREWAGTKAVGTAAEKDPDTARPFSWRG